MFIIIHVSVYNITLSEKTIFSNIAIVPQKMLIINKWIKRRINQISENAQKGRAIF